MVFERASLLFELAFGGGGGDALMRVRRGRERVPRGRLRVKVLGGDSVVLQLRATGIKRGPDSGATSVQRAWRAMLLPVLVAIPKVVPSMMFSLAE